MKSSNRVCNIRLSRLLFIGVLLFGFAMIVPGAERASAAHNGAYLIDNQVFIDSYGTPGGSPSMSKSQIQSFLASKGSGLASRSYKLNCYGQDSKERQWYTSIGAPCDQTVSAAQIIYYTGRVYGVNPKVILATMQKEQSLITSPNPTSWQVNNAMGYGCPTDGSCSNPGFFVQLDYGTWALRYHYERARGNNDWWRPSSGWTCGTTKNYYKPNLYPGTSTSFYDGSGVRYRIYTIANAATSALYCYTPHTYNNPKGLYNLPKFGTKGQYYSGSYWFVTWFERWFGSVRSGPLKFKPLAQPRWMEVNTTTRKSNLRLGIQTGGTLDAGQQIYFDTKVEINGEWYLRSSHDTTHKLEIGLPLSRISDIDPEYVSLETPRQMRVAVNTYNKQPITSENVDSVARGTKLTFDTKVKIGNRWYLRSEADTQSDSLRGIPSSHIYEVLTYEALLQPRWMEIKTKTHKIDPQNRRHIGPTLYPDREILFDTKIVHDGKTYLRSSYDTSRDMEQAVLWSDLKELNPDFVRLEKPRWMQLATSANKKLPATGENTGSSVAAGTPFFFDTKVKLGDTWYMRSSVDKANGSAASFLLTDLEELEPQYSSLESPRQMTLTQNAHKQHVADRSHVGPLLTKGRKIYFDTKVKLGEVWYLRSSYDTSRDVDYVIPVNKLK